MVDARVVSLLLLLVSAVALPENRICFGCASLACGMLVDSGETFATLRQYTHITYVSNIFAVVISPFESRRVCIPQRERVLSARQSTGVIFLQSSGRNGNVYICRKKQKGQPRR